MSPCLVALVGAPRPPRLLTRLRDRGVPVTVVEVVPGIRWPGLPLSGVVVVGGPVSPYDERSVPFGTIGSLLASTVARRIPTLGIGGGAHLLAVALGARLTLPESRSPGVRTVRRTAQARTDALFSGMPETSTWVECTRLALNSLPVGSEVLAVGEDGEAQAARFGPFAWGLQGHLELDPATLEEYLRLHRDAGVLDDAARQAFEAAVARLPEIRPTWDPLLDAFADLVADPERPVPALGRR